MYIQRKMRGTSLLFIFSICIITFQQTQALRRIKRGSLGTQNKTQLGGGGALAELSRHSNNSEGMKIAEITSSAPQRHEEEEKEHKEHHTWAKKAVAAVEHAIDKAFASFSHKAVVAEKAKRHISTLESPATPTTHSDRHKSTLAHLLNKRGLGARLLDDMQLETGFGGGEGPSELLIIDDSYQPTIDATHNVHSYALHQPKQHSLAGGYKRLAEFGEELNNLNSPNVKSYHSNNNNYGNHNAHIMTGKQNEDNGISEGIVHKDGSTNRSHDHNGGENKDELSHRRNNGHVLGEMAGEVRDNSKYNGFDNTTNNSHNSNNNNDSLIGVEKHSANNQQQQQQQQQQHQLHNQHSLQQTAIKNSLPTLLSHSLKTTDGIGHRQQQQLQPLREKHDSEKSVDVGQKHLQQQLTSASLIAPHQQQQQQTQPQLSAVNHSNGKMLPMESLLKFANMMLYKVAQDGVPLQAQGAQLSVSGSPTTSVISIGPVVEGAEDVAVMDYLYNPFEQQLSYLRNSAPLTATPQLISGAGGGTALVPRSFMLPPYSLTGSPQPINFIENAIDLLMSAEDEGNEELELVCPIHHPRKKSSGSGGDTKDKNGVIQVCSCRLYKKNKNS
ncbi:putative uncharacterized protein DDB_G0292292 isoform X2 [Ceratitis capitata]|uniref:putative uncharacterized protein DDB_G0292292 isoform X2 n=1 Tax=Ceratitis capitata TaxID=7213 RepID=UPI00032A3E7D|nr:putative uncharacterized protein DDB_G0292292 isoform X2 [Ceratitis capitata]